MNASLLIIGDEILNGTTQDSNSNFIARQLFAADINLVGTLAAGDTAHAIKNGLDYLFSISDLVITSGGLGPTKDDITKKVIADYFGSGLVMNERVLEMLGQRFASRGQTLNPLNEAQALVPESAEVIPSEIGTAPVLWLQKGAKTLIALPGVPRELHYLMENEVMPRIKERFLTGVLIHESFQLAGIAESNLALKLEKLEQEMENAGNEKEQYRLAYLPDLNRIRLMLKGIGENEEEVRKKIDRFSALLVGEAGEFIYGRGNDTLPEVIGSRLREKKKTLATAESCTGAYIGHLLTSVPGSSDYYTGGVISYANEVKEKELGVSSETLKKYGAVSEETLQEMLCGCLARFHSDYALATTGIAGPTGGSEEKPVGTVWIGVACPSKIITRKLNFHRNRLDNIQLFSVAALDLLRKNI